MLWVHLHLRVTGITHVYYRVMYYIKNKNPNNLTQPSVIAQIWGRDRELLCMWRFVCARMLRGWIWLIKSIVGRMSVVFIAWFESSTGNKWMRRSREGV